MNPGFINPNTNEFFTDNEWRDFAAYFADVGPVGIDPATLTPSQIVLYQHARSVAVGGYIGGPAAGIPPSAVAQANFIANWLNTHLDENNGYDQTVPPGYNWIDYGHGVLPPEINVWQNSAQGQSVLIATWNANNAAANSWTNKAFDIVAAVMLTAGIGSAIGGAAAGAADTASGTATGAVAPSEILTTADLNAVSETGAVTVGADTGATAAETSAIVAGTGAAAPAEVLSAVPAATVTGAATTTGGTSLLGSAASTVESGVTKAGESLATSAVMKAIAPAPAKRSSATLAQDAAPSEVLPAASPDAAMSPGLMKAIAAAIAGITVLVAWGAS